MYMAWQPVTPTEQFNINRKQQRQANQVFQSNLHEKQELQQFGKMLIIEKPQKMHVYKWQFWNDL